MTDIRPILLTVSIGDPNRPVKKGPFQHVHLIVPAMHDPEDIRVVQDAVALLNKSGFRCFLTPVQLDMEPAEAFGHFASIIANSPYIHPISERN